jgi:tetratricopeptide (TPR) repeat protein
MKALLKLLAIICCSMTLASCWSPRIPNTNDPMQKLEYSVELLDMKDRPPEAERLIREAIELYRNQKNTTELQVQQNQLNLAEAYLRYAYFFRSVAVVEWKDYYQKKGFLDKSVTYERRLDKSLEYFNQARDIAVAHKKYDMLTNIDRNMAWTHIQKKDIPAACKAFDDSLADNIEFEKTVPVGTKIVLPPPYKTFAELVAAEKSDTGCPNNPVPTPVPVIPDDQDANNSTPGPATDSNTDGDGSSSANPATSDTDGNADIDSNISTDPNINNEPRTSTESNASTNGTENLDSEGTGNTDTPTP